MPRVDGLDGLRTLSAFGVIIYHSLGAILGGNPAPGLVLPPVALAFFLVSGYVIYRPMVIADLGGTPQPKLRPFYTSRILRVVPLWWLAVGTYLIAFGTEPLQSVRDWILTFAILQVLDVNIRYDIIGPAWALSTEWVFYLVAPLWARLIIVLRRSLAPRVDRARWQLGGTALVGIICIFTPPARPFIATVVGVACAIVDVERVRTGRDPWIVSLVRSPWFTPLVTVVGAGLLLVYPYSEGLSVQWAESDLPLLAIWIAMATAWFAPLVFGRRQGRIRTALGGPLMMRLALLTYGLFLWHELFLSAILRGIGADVNIYAALYIVIVGSLVLSTITFIGLEEPLILLRRRWGNSRTPLPPPIVEHSLVQRARALGALEGLRVVAAAAVIGFHVISTTATSPAWQRAANVTVVAAALLFLMLSAFVLYRTVIGSSDGSGPRIGPGRFMLDRLARLYPLYWCAQAVMLAQRGTETIHGWGDWAQIVLLIPLPDTRLLSEVGLGPLTIVLVAEVILGFLVPVQHRVADRLAKRNGWLRAQIMTLTVLVALALLVAAAESPAAILFIPVVAGIGLAVIEAEQRRRRQRFAFVTRFAPHTGFLGGLSLGILVLDWMRSNTVAGDPVFGVDPMEHLVPAMTAAAIILFAVVLGPQRSPLHRFLAHAMFRYLADATYGLYLFTIPVLIALIARVDLPGTAVFVLVGVASVMIGTAAHRLVVEPARALVLPSSRDASR